MDHFTIRIKGDDRQVTIHAGATLLEAVGRAGIILNSFCSGTGTCGKCRVLIEPDNQEVLACQHLIDRDLTITIPADSRLSEHQILEHGIERQIEICPTAQAPGPGGGFYGVAVDIGTTTVVARLIDMTDGRIVETQAVLNPQTKFGDDVVSRIAYADTDEKRTELQQVIIDALNDLIQQACEKSQVAPNDIYEVCVVCNTTMNHLFLRLPVAQLGQAPYHAYSLHAYDRPAADFGIKINPAGNIHTVENIAGFVGSDTTAVALATDMDKADEMTLAVDIGTNGELILGDKKKLYSASCAAGPAFEGARISCGTRAVTGAIEAVVINGDDIDIDVIGSTQARSICGSGLIDAVAVMLDLGVLDATGRFLDPNELSDDVPDAIRSRLIEINDAPTFVLSPGDSDHTVALTQRDIRQVQLGKAAIRTGTKLLQNKLGLADNDIKHVLLAGAFGNYIRAQSALRIGLLPDVPVERIRFVGNAAGSGARMVLLSRKARNHISQLAKNIQYIEIAHDPNFPDTYADSMLF
jgi:uncharacterized 2Fe-2S/4Fe-4S cluster protein (DUF4445 family)